MVGTGVFTSLGYQLIDIDTAFPILLLWLIGGIISLFGAFSYSELASVFPRSGGEYNILSNRSKTGYLIPDQKSINYFLITKNRNWRVEKRQIINKLRQNKEVLLVFEFDTQKNKYTDRFFLNDTEN